MTESRLAKYQKTGDLNILVKLYEPYRVKVFRMCMHYLKQTEDSEDAVVDIFLELKDKIPRYEIDNFPAWLHTLVRNHCLKKLRVKSRMLLQDEIFIPDRMESASEDDLINEWLEKLPEAIDALDERQRWCVVLFYLRGKTYKEIEAIMQYSPMEVKSAIQNGKVKLKKFLERHVQ